MTSFNFVTNIRIALVYHAYAGSEKGRQSSVESLSPETELDSVGSDGYDVAVKVFKRIVEFKGRCVS